MSPAHLGQGKLCLSMQNYTTVPLLDSFQNLLGSLVAAVESLVVVNLAVENQVVENQVVENQVVSSSFPDHVH